MRYFRKGGDGARVRVPQGRWARILIVVCVAAAVAGLAGVVQAAIPDTNGVIHGCYSANGSTGNGGTQLNIVDSAKASCSKGQAQVTWSQTGPQGPPGTNGTNGTNGTSVTSTALSPGDANCPTGGSSFTSVSGTTYACNGAQGLPGSPTFYSFTTGYGIAPQRLAGNTAEFSGACFGDSTFGFDYTQLSGSATWWLDDNGAVTTGAVTAGGVGDSHSFFDDNGTGTHHATIRIITGTYSYQWDVFVNSTFGSSCDMSVAEQDTSTTSPGSQ
jgi:hypothetical protein